MYRCQDCGKKFTNLNYIEERHNLDTPPYEKTGVCPFCSSQRVFPEERRYCRCCGYLLPDGAEEYCNSDCRQRGLKLWNEERRRYRRASRSPISQTVREVENYNKEHGTSLSYGQYVAFVMSPKRRKRK